MAQLLVRDLPTTLVKHLKERAAQNGVSSEEEHRRILKSALGDDDAAKNRAFVAHLLSAEGRGDDLPVRPRKVSAHRRVKF